MSTKSLDKKRLKKLLLLALSSDQPGEVMAALGKVKAVLAKADLDVHWLTDTMTVAPAMPMSDPFTRWAHAPVPVVPWIDMVGYLDVRRGMLKEREREFLDSLMSQWAGRDYWQPSERQGNWLTAIYRRTKGI